MHQELHSSRRKLAFETPAGSHPSLIHSLEELSATIPTDVAYTFLPEGEDEEINITFRELEMRAKAVAARLQQLAHQGDRAALVYESSLEYIVALVGCFYAGIVAVPVYPPDPMRIRRTGARLRAILQDSQADIVLTSSNEANRFGSYLEQAGHVVVTDEIAAEDSEDYLRPEIGPETLALLQYTSGSTGRPRGVMLTHSNLMFNFEHIKKFDEPNAVAVSWLPMYHDMGLIGLVLQVLQSGRRTVLMSPLSFVKRPVRWLKAITKYKAYATSGPSFAYDLCVQKISDEEMAELDLSSWTLACNGAEPVRPDTMRRFAERFAPVGFRYETFYPCYGLAEATLIVSGGDKAAEPIIRHFDSHELADNHVVPVADGQGRAIVGCGISVDRQDIAIVDPVTLTRSAPDQIGEIWVRGPGIARGYWNSPEATAETFQATLPGEKGSFLRTGDMGFLDDGELFVTGRIKDLIIVRGRNHYPQDIERTVEGAHPALRRDHVVSFGVDVDGEERVVVVCGVMRAQKLNQQELFSAVRAVLAQEHELGPHAIVLVKGSEIPRTSSGKLQRRGCKDLYLRGDLEIVGQWTEDSIAEPVVQVPPLAKSPLVIEPLLNGHAAMQRSIVDVVVGIIRELKEYSASVAVTENSQLFADLAIESIDLVMLNELVERHYQRQFPFADFMAELGRLDQRDVSISQFANFIRLQLEADGAPHA
jgi:acyl-CoA synthetase (AMP-forming)/AMP-acid ligase II/acyl carrier protein